MAQEIYNEGRVVGLSAWELFMRQAVSNGVAPEDIPSESQWLTAMLGSGASMILKIPTGTTQGMHEYELPVGSNLAAAGIIVASPFIGSCEYDLSGWAKKITSYGAMIKNTSGSGNYPTSTSVPYDTTYNNTEYSNCVTEYSKITDGIVYINNANWVDAQSTPPQKDIDPNFNESTSVVRLYISSTINNDMNLLLTGFTNKRILQGLSGYASDSSGGSTDIANNDWKNGGMLGPEIIPWASKIIFTVPNAVYNNTMTRTIPSDTSYNDGTYYDYTITDHEGSVNYNSILDFNSINLTDYYDNKRSTFIGDPTLSEDVTQVTDKVNELIAWYPGLTATQINSATDNSKFFPPALYAAQISDTGTQTLVPVDIAAPGTVKFFKTSAEAIAYNSLIPDNYGAYIDPTYGTYIFTPKTSTGNKESGTGRLKYNSGTSTYGGYYPTCSMDIHLADKLSRVITLTNPGGGDWNWHGNQGVIFASYNSPGIGGTPGPSYSWRSGNISWDQLFTGMYNGSSVNLLGQNAGSYATELDKYTTLGVLSTFNDNITWTIPPISNIGATKFTVDARGSNSVEITSTSASDSTKVVKIEDGKSIKVGTQFIEFADGKRLYISGTQPTGSIPNGSIGIGW